MTYTIQNQPDVEEDDELTDQEKIEKFKTIGKVSKDSDGKIITDENEEKVEVTFKSYCQLIKYGGGWIGILWANIF